MVHGVVGLRGQSLRSELGVDVFFVLLDFLFEPGELYQSHYLHFCCTIYEPRVAISWSKPINTSVRFLPPECILVTYATVFGLCSRRGWWFRCVGVSL